jgi:hypothetical protein
VELDLPLVEQHSVTLNEDRPPSLAAGLHR